MNNIDTLIDEHCTPIKEGKTYVGNIITEEFMQALNLYIEEKVRKTKINTLEDSLKSFRSTVDDSDFIFKIQSDIKELRSK